mmetsp:Transcript_45807/g.81863  ORF Transcript_45807/g.81863 Transcript_45807/m.81863 type:complete len:322 (+) Transcript_45807:265-1230(+)
MPDADCVNQPIIVAPELQDLVMPTSHKPLTTWRDVEGINPAGVRTLQLADGGALIRVPVCDLAVRATGHDLALIIQVRNRLEVGLGVHDVGPHEAIQVPNDAGAVIRGSHAVGIVGPHANGIHGGLVLLHAGLHHLRVPAQLPHPHLRVRTTSDQTPVVVADCQGSHSGKVSTDALHPLDLVGIIDDIQQLARLGAKGTDLAVTPPADDALPVRGEANAIALEVLDLDPQQLLACAGIPDTDVMVRAGGEQLAVFVREADIVDPLKVAGLPQLLLEGLGVQVVHVRLVGANKVVVSVHCYRADATLQRERLVLLQVLCTQQ